MATVCKVLYLLALEYTGRMEHQMLKCEKEGYLMIVQDVTRGHIRRQLMVGKSKSLVLARGAQGRRSLFRLGGQAGFMAGVEV